LSSSVVAPVQAASAPTNALSVFDVDAPSILSDALQAAHGHGPATAALMPNSVYTNAASSLIADSGPLGLGAEIWTPVVFAVLGALGAWTLAQRDDYAGEAMRVTGKYTDIAATKATELAVAAAKKATTAATQAVKSL